MNRVGMLQCSYNANNLLVTMSGMGGMSTRAKTANLIVCQIACVFE